jgi:hypothetical protein
LPAPTLDTAPPTDELAAIVCPIDRAAAISRLARTYGTLSTPLAKIRRAALLEARAAGHKVTALAARTGLSEPRISQLTAQAAS